MYLVNVAFERLNLMVRQNIVFSFPKFIFLISLHLHVSRRQFVIKVFKQYMSNSQKLINESAVHINETQMFVDSLKLFI